MHNGPPSSDKDSRYSNNGMLFEQGSVRGVVELESETSRNSQPQAQGEVLAISKKHQKKVTFRVAWRVLARMLARYSSN
jgi:hypothetical protein